MIKKFLIGMSFLGICMGASFANTDEKKYVLDLENGLKRVNIKL